ncbi:uncharacterized protein M6B38_104620 [Iris pallida]|uniref:Uncharacterized protein n=1 Tax=Iris pallida TaxID=29817 RepID=A0AAX6F3P7_IRIPA|nr:uncharacterized protein M6B38_104620 [Iris pallida]
MDNCPLRGLIWRRKPKDSFFNGNNEGASTSGIHGEGEEEDEYVRDNSSLLSLQPWVFRKESFGGDTSQASLRNRRLGRFSVKPLGSIEHVGLETFSLSSSPPNSPVARPASVRPFSVTDGERIISRSRFGSVSWKEDGDGVGLGLEGCVIGVPPLPKSRRSKRKSGDGENGRLGGCGLLSCFNFSHSKGSVDGVLLFCLGVGIGVITIILLNKAELEKLNKLLKHTENVVQDLQEELEMKDSLSVKDLTCGTNQNLQHFDAKESINLWGNQKPASHSTADEKERGHLDFNKAGDNSDEPLSKIEAELEVELQRLEENINFSDRGQRISDLSELDPDIICDVVHGELQVRDLSNEMLESLAASASDSGTASTNQTNNANYSVSPKELSIRLHEVIQTRLEERIEELERELEERQKRLPFLEGDRASSPMTFSNSEMEFSSNQESPAITQQDQFCSNVSGDALNGYEEAYEEFMLMAAIEKPPSSVNKGAAACVEEGYKSNSSSISLAWENMLWIRESDDTLKKDEHDIENDNFDDEEGKLLIQQILERKRQGSPVVINAHKLFLSFDE